MPKKLLIILQVPWGATITDAKEYAKAALEHWGGGFHPEDPFFPGEDGPKVLEMKEQK